MTRIYVPQKMVAGLCFVLDAAAANHVANVLRLKAGDELILFNGDGGEFYGVIESVSKRQVIVKVGAFKNTSVESPLKIHLGQGLVRNEKMELIIQKAVELGVTAITPLITERCNVHLDGDRLNKKMAHWQKIAISACEQCGRNVVPMINSLQPLSFWLKNKTSELSLLFSPDADKKLNRIARPPASVTILIGSEGGLTAREIEQAQEHEFLAVSLGPRILRTETAGLTALSVVQAHWGDLGFNDNEAEL